MTETHDIQTLRAHFAKKAVLPKTQIAQARKFLDHLTETTLNGGPSVKDVRAGQKILHTLEEKTELFEFHAAILAGQEASNEKDLDRRVKAIAKSAQVAEDTTSRLREALKTIA